jgi:acetate kinase
MGAILVVNAGSTSLKLSLVHEDESADRVESLDAVDVAGLDAVAHRVVHGGPYFTEPVVIDDAVRRTIHELEDLAPLHNAPALRGIEEAVSTHPGVPHIAVFDTAFHATIPPEAATYALPRAWREQWGIRRYGFHGLSVQWAAERVRVGRLVVCHLGGGCSVTAVRDGHSVDTTMGFTPLEGLVMQTRCGDIDPSVVPYLAKRLGESCERVIELLNRECGLAGVSGRDIDMSKLVDEDSPDARLAVDLFCVRARKYLGAYLALMGGCDGVAFGGGIGEHVAAIRARIVGGMEWSGLSLDNVVVVAVDEELALARAAQQALRA